MTKPDYNLCARPPIDEDGRKARFHQVGVAWKNEDGSIHIRLNPFVDLGRMGPGTTLKLFEPGHGRRRYGPPLLDDDDFGDDDIPF